MHSAAALTLRMMACRGLRLPSQPHGCPLRPALPSLAMVCSRRGGWTLLTRKCGVRCSEVCAAVCSRLVMCSWHVKGKIGRLCGQQGAAGPTSRVEGSPKGQEGVSESNLGVKCQQQGSQQRSSGRVEAQRGVTVAVRMRERRMRGNRWHVASSMGVVSRPGVERGCICVGS